MNNTLVLDITRYEPVSEHIRYDTGLMKLLAEQDYLLARQLIPASSFVSMGLFHYQQAVEKFLKSYLRFRGDTTEFMKKRIGHRLDLLLDMCKPYDAFFDDKQLALSCAAIRPFADVGRYPNYSMQQVGLSLPSVFTFLDEFVWRMRELFQPREPGEDIADEIEVLYMTQRAEENGFRGFYGLTQASLIASFEAGNAYADRIKAQFQQLDAPKPGE